MRKRINSIFLAMLALFAFQGNVSAQDVLYETVFDTQEAINKWTKEGFLESQWDFVQANPNNNGQVALNGYENDGVGLVTSYFVSPSIALTENNKIAFNSTNFNFNNKPIEELTAVVVRTIGGEWVEIPGITHGTNWKTLVLSEMDVPAEFNNQNVQFGFKYMNDAGDNCGTWFIKDFKVTSAGGAVDPGISEKTLFDKSGEELFNATYNGFSIEGYQGLDSWQTVWNFNNWGGPFGINVNNIAFGDTNIETYFVTPVIRLHVNNKIEVGHTVIGYAAGEAEKHLALCIREVGATEWDVVEGFIFGEDNVETFTDFLSINTKYDDKKVQFGFKYTAEDANTAGTWYLSSIMVVGDAPDPVEAGISYDVTEYKYEIGSKDPFKAPVINNPNELPVKYETSDWDIATVDQNGNVEIGGNKQGTVTITARTEECVEFLAGEASYTIEVVDPILVFKAPFQNDECGFTEETTSTNVWKFNWGNVSAQNPVDAATTSYYVSPEIQLPADGSFVSFYHAAQGIANIQDHAGLCIREIGGEWTEITVEKWPAEGSFWWDLISTGDILVPAEFNGKTVQFGFRFTLDETTFAENIGNDWPNTKYVINNFLVTKYIERAEAELSFNKAEYTYYMGEIPFESPVVNNPNELQVSYATDMNGGSDVVNINNETGEVTILDSGDATIFARSSKNNEYNAGEASYQLHAVDLTIIYRHRFGKDGLGEFTQEGGEGIWSFDGYVNTGASTNQNLPENTKGYLVSPVITLDANGNKASWKENGYNCDFANQALFAVREVGGEWQEIPNIDRSAENYGGMTEVFCEIPSEFNGKDVQVAFIFVQGDPFNWQSWNINDLKIRKEFVKVDPKLSFDKQELEVVMNGEYEAPVLNNAENVDVVYSSSDVLVATVNELTGKLEILGVGETVITASSKEDNKYLASEASYVLNVVTVPTGINGVNIDLDNAKIYDLQGNRIQNVVKGNIYIINGKKVLVK